MIQTTHTITFTRDWFNTYKTLVDEANTNKKEYFIVGVICKKVIDGENLVKAFEPHFKNSEIQEATIPYNF